MSEQATKDTTRSEITERAAFEKIRYAQCWEDPEILATGLAITEADTVISIASGGDNSFALLLKEPARVIGLDLSAVQIAVCELKAAAIKDLSHTDFVAFIGARSTHDRLDVYEKLRPQLTQRSMAYWDSQPEILSAGIIHAGKFEKYFGIFRRWILPLIHTSTRVDQLLEDKPAEARERYFENEWSNRRWKALFKLFFSEFMLGRLGRDPEFFRFMTEGDVAGKLIERTRYAMTVLPTHKNWFMEFILRGQYLNLEHAHPYLRTENYHRLQTLLPRISWELASVEHYLEEQQTPLSLKLNLSDIFEYMSEEAYGSILQLIHTKSVPGSRLAYWNLFVPRSLPETFGDRFTSLENLSKQLWEQDKAFFYSAFRIDEVI